MLDQKLKCYRILLFVLSLIILLMTITLVLVSIGKISSNKSNVNNERNADPITKQNTQNNALKSELNGKASPSQTNTVYTKKETINEEKIVIRNCSTSPLIDLKPQTTRLSLQSSVTSDVCLTDECVDTAVHLSTPIDYSVNPCDDFYEFACGNWARQNPVPRNWYNWHNLAKLNNLISQNIKRDLKARNVGDKLLERKTLAKVYDLYHGCINQTLRNISGYSTLKSKIVSIGGWPTMQPHWSAYKFNLQNALITSMKMNHFPLINIEVVKNWREKDKNIISEMVKISKAFNPLGSLDPLKFYLDFTSVENFFLQAIESSTITYPLDTEYLMTNFDRLQYSVKELNKLLPYINMQQILNSVVGTIDPDTKVLVPDINYLVNISRLIETTSERTLSNYIAVTFLMNYGGYTTYEMQNVLADDLENLDAEKLSDLCFEQTSEHLPNLLGRIYVDKYFDNQSMSEMTQIVDLMQQSFSKSLDENNWMDANTKSEAILKIKNIQKNVAYPKWIENDDDLDRYYSKITVTKSDYLSSILNILKERQRRDFVLNHSNSQLLMENWPEKGAITVGAFYKFLNNGIYFPAGIAQYPFFIHDRPMTVNLGSIGVVIGHEMTHSLDNHGRYYDHGGDYRNWWTDTTLKAFNDKSKCFVNQYNKFQYPEHNMTVNGTSTLSENIADNGGIRQAYRAFKIYQNQRVRPFQPLPGRMKNITEDQLFFISFANMWCSNTMPIALETKLKKYRHSPEAIRVNASLVNFDKFAEAFNCRTAAKMNPKDKCVLW